MGKWVEFGRIGKRERVYSSQITRLAEEKDGVTVHVQGGEKFAIKGAYYEKVAEAIDSEKELRVDATGATDPSGVRA
jgi:hypothetical protein